MDREAQTGHERSTTMKRLLLLAVAIGALLVGASPAQAALEKGVGAYAETNTTCYRFPNRPDLNKVIVQPPVMSSSPITIGSSPTYTWGPGFVSGFHVQRVGYQAFLYKWNASSNVWVHVQTGPLLLGYAGDRRDLVAWDSGINGGSTWFQTPQRGHYKIALRFHWFADTHAPGGTAEGFGSVYELGYLPYCSF
jgi:hypothetical protein